MMTPEQLAALREEVRKVHKAFVEASAESRRAEVAWEEANAKQAKARDAWTDARNRWIEAIQ